LTKLPDTDLDKSNRRGCFLVAAVTALIVLLLSAVGMNWMGQVDGSKQTELPVAGLQI
jgi:hypothetical protein